VRRYYPIGSRFILKSQYERIGPEQMKIKPMFLILIAFLATIGCSPDETVEPAPPQPAQPVQTVVYLMRHAETAGLGPDPDLSPIGLDRANNWVVILQEVAFEAFYSTNYNRTRQTIEPIATSNGQGVILYDPADLSLADVVADHAGSNVLIVGHSNTIPPLINAHLGTDVYPDMTETEHGNLYKVTVLDGAVSHEMTVHN
jgi:2,3-bisphosphoglycerate-dependent phosphoglycerate mutase